MIEADFISAAKEKIMSFKHQRAGLSILVLVVSLSMFGCGDSGEPQTDAPGLPPVESMSLDLGFFESNNTAALRAAEHEHLNFLNAAIRVAYIHAAVVHALIPPTTAFALAIHSVPTLQDDGSYLWVFTWNDQGQEHQIRLRGMVEEDWVEWDLYLVPSGQDPEPWFSGRSHRDRDEGFWVFRDFTREGDPEVLQIDWDLTQENHANLALENIDVDGEDYGDRLEFLGIGANRSMEFIDSSDDMTWFIEWNEVNHSGSLMVPDYNDGNRACWNNQLVNVECPSDS